MQSQQLNLIQLSPIVENKPEKKYFESCFKDDEYESTDEYDSASDDDEKNAPPNKPIFKMYDILQRAEIDPPEILIKKLMDEGDCSDKCEAELVAKLINLKYDRDDALSAKECANVNEAISLLQKDCELCNKKFPINEIVSMLKCTHKCCKDCAKKFFTVQITDRSINDCNCPYCKQPDFHDPNSNEDEILEYFSNLDIFLKNILEPDVHELFQRKLRDRSLMQDPNFKWCVQCTSGFFARPKQKRLICPDCGSVTCAQCRKNWEKQHEGLTCEKYLQWLNDNNADKQAEAVAKYLENYGIDCPKCSFTFSLSSGGCMHLVCSQCKFEFCSGCKKPFLKGSKCKVTNSCDDLGLHAHHPRNCIYYLRDKEPHQLQNLLDLNNVAYDTQSNNINGNNSNCPILIQKETPNGLTDSLCENEVPINYAGLCSQHYVEYLVKEVSKANIDPLPIFDLTDCQQELRRRGIQLPERGPWDTDEIYREICSKVVAEKIPLN